MDDKVCPFCGAAKLNPPQYAMDYECGHFDNPGYRHQVCAMRQIAQLTERLEAWRAVGYKVKNADVSFDVINKLKALGEI